MPPDLRSFMERVAAGEVNNPEAEILDEIDNWHSGSGLTSLDYYLGMSPQEYRAWVENRSSIVQLVERRKAP